MEARTSDTAAASEGSSDLAAAVGDNASIDDIFKLDPSEGEEEKLDLDMFLEFPENVQSDAPAQYAPEAAVGYPMVEIKGEGEEDTSKSETARRKDNVGGPSHRSKRHKRGLPKRPLSAYNIFFQQERVRVYEEAVVRITFEQLGKIIGKRWRQLSKTDRRKYDDLAEKEVQRYRKEREQYDRERRRNKERLESAHLSRQQQSSSQAEGNVWMPAPRQPSAGLGGQSFSWVRAGASATSGYVGAPYLEGAEFMLPDQTGREVKYRVSYTCQRTKMVDARNYTNQFFHYISQYGHSSC